MAIKFPARVYTDTIPSAVENAVREYLYIRRAMERLRFLHNKILSWYRDGGKGQAFYDALPAKIRNLVPYTPQITRAQFNWYEVNVYQPWQDHILSELGRLRKLAEDYTGGADIDFDSDVDGDNL